MDEGQRAVQRVLVGLQKKAERKAFSVTPRDKHMFCFMKLEPGCFLRVPGSHDIIRLRPVKRFALYSTDLKSFKPVLFKCVWYKGGKCGQITLISLLVNSFIFREG